jgi:hypothetical protein
VCGAHICIEPSCPPGDAPCPACGCLVWFSSSSIDFQLSDSRSTRRDSPSLEIRSGPSVGAATLDVAHQGYQLSAACLFVIASLTFLAAALADSCWHARAVSEMVGGPGLFLLIVSLVCLFHSGALDEGHSIDAIQSSESAIVDHPMR